jgi:hypothetical protein
MNAGRYRCGEIELALVAQSDVLQHLRQGLAESVGRLAVAPTEVRIERLVIEVGGRGAFHRHDVGVNQARALEQPLDFLACRDVAFVRTALDPDAALVVEVGLAQAIGHGDSDYHALRRLDVFRCRMNRRPHVLRSGIRDQLVQAPHAGRVQPDHAAIVGRTQQQHPAAAIGERRQLGRDAVGAGLVALELVATVFAAREELQEISFVHGPRLFEITPSFPAMMAGSL